MREVIDIRVRQHSLFWPVLLIILAFMYWKWVLMIVGLLAAVFLLSWAIKCLHEDARDQAALQNLQRQQQRQEHARLLRNATVENDLFHRGDPRGVYGLDYHDGKELGS